MINTAAQKRNEHCWFFLLLLFLKELHPRVQRCSRNIKSFLLISAPFLFPISFGQLQMTGGNELARLLCLSQRENGSGGEGKRFYNLYSDMRSRIFY